MCHDPIFVYALGKVGGTTIERTLDKAGIEAVHLHTLFPEGRGIEEALCMPAAKDTGEK